MIVLNLNHFRYSYKMESLNKYIDHTLLKPTATKEQIKTLCDEAILHNFKSVCISPTYVTYAKSLLKETSVLVCTVIGFPLGVNCSQIKAAETKLAIEQGADEIDMVINMAALKQNDFTYVENDIKAVVEESLHKTVKVILETCLLTEKEIIYGCEISAKAGATFVKTSTGFSTDGATISHVELMRKSIPQNMMVKASGGIKSKKDAIAMIKAGADRLGTSSGVALMEDGQISTDEY
jgi:deoxyribose-phosphate aldolase